MSNLLKLIESCNTQDSRNLSMARTGLIIVIGLSAAAGCSRRLGSRPASDKQNGGLLTCTTSQTLGFKFCHHNLGAATYTINAMICWLKEIN